MTAHAASMKPVPGATAAHGTPSLPALPSVAVRPLGVSPHDADDDEENDRVEDVSIPGGRASLGRQVVEEDETDEDEAVSGAWDDAEESDEEGQADDAFAEEDESESFIVDSNDTGPEVDGDGDEYGDEDEDEQEDEDDDDDGDEQEDEDGG